MLDNFLTFCKLTQLLHVKKYLEERQQEMHQNPQQDDFQPNRSLPVGRGVTSKHRKSWQDALDLLKPVRFTFLKFLMFFYEIGHIDALIMKTMFPPKQRKLSHLIAITG